jgi:hypothetical protein
MRYTFETGGVRGSLIVFGALFAPAALLIAALTIGAGCDGEKVVVVADKPAAPAGAAPAGAQADPEKKAEAPVPKAEPNYIVGRVSMGDGGPPRGEIKDITISITGVSDAGGRVSYSPEVKADGTFRQKVLPGQYTFDPCRITVRYNNTDFAFRLEPVGKSWNKSRDVTEGIVQEFLWKVTGVTTIGQADGEDPQQAPHWYGMSIGMSPTGWRNDINKAAPEIPEGSKLTFTLKPTGKSIDGRELKPLTIERTIKRRQNPDLHDLVPAPYEITCVATLPDGKTAPLLFSGPLEKGKYVKTTTVAVEMDNIVGRMHKPLFSIAIE